jgi:predicted RNase H-like HicB family nuclease
MSAKSKSSAKGNKQPRSPFASAILGQARQVAQRYQVVMHFEDDCWYGRGLELPLVFGEGATPEACIGDTREALTLAVATMLELGQRPPAPAVAGRRTEQVNVRLTAEEKMLLEASAKQKGFSGLSDFIRAAAVEATR